MQLNYTVKKHKYVGLYVYVVLLIHCVVSIYANTLNKYLLNIE